jgi:hypothetical protein
LCKQAFDGGKAAAEGAGFDVEVQFGAGEGAGLGFEDVAGQIFLILYIDCNPSALFGDFASGLDFIASV